MTTSKSKGRFFTKRIDSNDSHNESNRIDSNRELECSTARTTELSIKRVRQASSTKALLHKWRSCLCLMFAFILLS